MKINGLKLKLNVLYFILFGSLACVSPFLTPYFQKRGLSFSQIGILFATYSLVGVLGQPFWGIITDKYASKKATMIITMSVSGILIFGFIFSKEFYSILLALTVFMFFQSSIISVNDANTYDLIDVHRNIQYGRIRLMGSIGYALTSLALGIVIKLTSINVPFLVYFVYIAVGLVLLNTINEKSRRTGSSINVSDIVRIIKNKRFILISVSALIANAAFGSSGNYIAVLIEKTGGDVANLGMLWFIIAMSELPAFFFGSRILKKYGVLNIYLIGLAFYIMRFFVNSLCTSYLAVLAIQLLQGVSFTLYLMSTLQYVTEIVPAETRTTALTLFAAIAGGIGGFIGNIGGGVLLQRITVFQLYRIFALLCALSLAIGLILKKIDKKAPSV